MEIFGHAPSTEMMTFNIFNDLYVSIRDNHDLIIISDEIGKTKPATLFFLSKFGCLSESIVFLMK
jgi:FMN phosphatase YigB (HAD superfamily)